MQLHVLKSWLLFLENSWLFSLQNTNPNIWKTLLGGQMIVFLWKNCTKYEKYIFKSIKWLHLSILVLLLISFINFQVRPTFHARNLLILSTPTWLLIDFYITLMWVIPKTCYFCLSLCELFPVEWFITCGSELCDWNYSIQWWYQCDRSKRYLFI